MSDMVRDSRGNGNGKAARSGNSKRGSRLVTTVSSHMVNYPVGLQAVRPEPTRKSLPSVCTICRTRS